MIAINAISARRLDILDILVGHDFRPSEDVPFPGALGEMLI